ncbi:hypothetical protein SAMN05444392_101313 [Seinonella peptonophila]|uniref:Uncharacterized protein n=1 Tax=Seinonella peptonophila TaxID=112248 RepID=A0A1M4T5D3_9BACL|nr:DUF4291 domain-containing protein [Seinonella peptonophila]SHE39605.1 hypothetical protein SAMN05444392_101313 [Seinonella peptonophila]
MNIQTELYDQYQMRCPKVGKHILATFDEQSIWVYQAYNESIGNFAVQLEISN